MLAHHARFTRIEVVESAGILPPRWIQTAMLAPSAHAVCALLHRRPTGAGHRSGAPFGSAQLPEALRADWR